MTGARLGIPLPDAAATDALGRCLADALAPGDTVLLEGPLGAGKTALARALIRTLADDPSVEVPSPTYTLVQDYTTPRGAVWHFDLYRLSGPDEVVELGWDEGAGAIRLVEWPDRLGPLAREAALILRLEPVGEGRRAILTAPGRRGQDILATLGGIA